MRNAEIARQSYLYGWPIDQARHAQIRGELETKIGDARRRFGELLDEMSEIPRDFRERFNPASPKQVSKLFYEFLEEPVRHHTKSGGDSTSKEALQEIVDYGSPQAGALAACLRDIKKFKKLKESYTDNTEGLPSISPQAHVTAQLTGRWSYRDPALQTVPAAIKPMFLAHPNGYLVACDLSQAELRNIAQLSGDIGMMTAYSRGEDIHAATAIAAFGCTPEEAKEKKNRNPAKIIGLGYNYSVLDDAKAAIGLHGQLIAKVPGLTVESMLATLQRLRAARGGVRTYKEALWERVQREDIVEEPLSKRQRRFYGKPKDTEAFNAPCQMMTATIVDAAIQAIAAEFDAAYREGLHLQRHDELILGGRDLWRLADMLWRHMRQTLTVNGNTLTYEIEYAIGNRWGEGMAYIEPIARVGQYDSDEAICNCAFGKEKTTITGLRNAVQWVAERVPPAPSE